MRKLTRKNLDELAKVMPVISEVEQRMFVGGGIGTLDDPYTMEEFERMLVSGTWEGGYVLYYNSSEPIYTLPEVIVTESSPNSNENTGNPVYDLMYKGGYEIGYKAGVTGSLLETAKAAAISGLAVFGMGSDI